MHCAWFPFCDRRSGEVCCVMHFQMLSAARGAELVLSLMANLGLVGCFRKAFFQPFCSKALVTKTKLKEGRCRPYLLDRDIRDRLH